MTALNENIFADIMPNKNTIMSILFTEDNLDPNIFVNAIKKRANIVKVNNDNIVQTNIVFSIYNDLYIFSYLNFPYDKSEIKLDTIIPLCNYIQEDEALSLKEHKSFALIAKMSENISLKYKYKICKNISFITYEIFLAIQSAIATFVATSVALKGRSSFIDSIRFWEQDIKPDLYFPTSSWILVYITKDKDKNKILRTNGLSDFGFKEIQITNLILDLDDALVLLYMLSMYEITGQKIFKHNDILESNEQYIAKFKNKQDGYLTLSFKSY